MQRPVSSSASTWSLVIAAMLAGAALFVAILFTGLFGFLGPLVAVVAALACFLLGFTLLVRPTRKPAKVLGGILLLSAVAGAVFGVNLLLRGHG